MAESFYCGQLGFGLLDRHSELVRIGEAPALLLEAVSPGPNPAFGQARVSLVLQVADLASVTNRFRTRGISLVTGNANPLPIGLAECFQDPFGNVHTLLQPQGGLPPGSREFQIHSIGVKTPIGLIPAARQIYETVLGFPALTERYYPPTLPLRNADGSLAFVIHDKHPWEPDLRPRAPLYPNDAGAVLVFLTDNATAMRDRLAMQGRIRLTAIEHFRLGRRFGIVDNAGIPSEVWECA